jgi:hypothetical protein
VLYAHEIAIQLGELIEQFTDRFAHLVAALTRPANTALQFRFSPMVRSFDLLELDLDLPRD